MFTSLLPYILLAPVFVSRTQCLCGESITWSHRVNMDDVFGLWYGVGYAQHSPNIPSEVGCISLFITDVNKYEDNWFDWSRSGYSPRNNWRSSKSNPWSENDMAGSWLDGRLKRQVKRSVEGEKRIRVLWDEDGNTSEQVYVYYEEEPGLWTAEQMQPSEKELISRGIDVWYPDDPPRHPGVIRIIKLTPHMLILNHCSEVGNGGIFSLILRRSSTTVQRWEWYQYQQQFYKFYLPNIYRFYAICAAGTEIGSFVIVLFCFISLFLIS
ncbi:uncharacterized protein LOC123864202 isoform X3 [Maniola jurtina]|uniref:uncharacterized protein LOC123864202 isoform X3 n=1 Tax=Maniola jurtina TaxID=191418 RepID=UPI001E687284|nr:uncharacterized protein LOC123864202 isoform X3 [Maniola jurtina]